jgi:hypothetical protein
MGGELTVTMAVLLVAPVPPLVEETAPGVLLLTPEVEPVTLTTIVQEPPPVIDPPDRLIEPVPAVAVTVPPHAPVNPFGVETTRPAGRVSVKATPVSAVDEFGLLIVKVSEVDPLSGIVEAPNALLIVGGATTVTLAEAVEPVPPSVEEIAPDVLFLTPEVEPVTLTAIEQEPLAVSDPPDRLIEPVPAVAVTVPPQVLVNPFGVETTSPEGRVSVKATPDSAVAEFGLAMEKVSEVEPLIGMLEAPNALLIVGGAMTVTVAVLLATPVPPLVEETGPVVLLLTPEVVPVTLTAIVQEPLAAIEPPAREIEPEPAVAVTVPPHAPVKPFGVATTSPAGKVSVKATPVNVTVFAAGLVMEKVSEVEPLIGMVEAPNALLMVGGAITVCPPLREPLLVL